MWGATCTLTVDLLTPRDLWQDVRLFQTVFIWLCQKWGFIFYRRGGRWFRPPSRRDVPYICFTLRPMRRRSFFWLKKKKLSGFLGRQFICGPVWWADVEWRAADCHLAGVAEFIWFIIVTYYLLFFFFLPAFTSLLLSGVGGLKCTTTTDAV